MNRRIRDRGDTEYGAGEQSYDPYYGAPAERDERAIGGVGENPYGYHGQYRRGGESAGPGPAGTEEFDIAGGGRRSASGSARPMRRYPPGPKGYRRSDERLTEDIYEELMRSPDLDTREVSLTVRAGEVWLEGSVPDRQMKHAIEDIAADCPGVIEVHNRIRVVPAPERAEGY